MCDDTNPDLLGNVDGLDPGGEFSLLLLLLLDATDDDVSQVIDEGDEGIVDVDALRSLDDPVWDGCRRERTYPYFQLKTLLFNSLTYLNIATLS